MPAPRTRRSPAWSSAELLDLIGIGGEEAVQSQLRSSHRNYDTYGQIYRCMIEKGHDQDTLQGRVKVKELRNAYHKAWEANRHSGAAPTSCWFYKELDMILGGDLTSTAKAPVDTSLAYVPVESGLSQEEAILDEEGWGTQRQKMTWRPEMHTVRSSFLPRRNLASHSSQILEKRKQERRPLRREYHKCEYALVQAAVTVNTQQWFSFNTLSGAVTAGAVTVSV
ncbi:hypothetical protein UY3_14366 [Chelonia mydas]|uniref:Myb/SANT-like DNA-binding domain-containing protein n=1 Tax=Chelonia mydas TaxID=8469 RepID=M7AZH3_CHEMY|nr:hypothetical protein UY3_14366 [Chelonia mydas]